MKDSSWSQALEPILTHTRDSVLALLEWDVLGLPNAIFRDKRRTLAERHTRSTRRVDRRSSSTANYINKYFLVPR